MDARFPACPAIARRSPVYRILRALHHRFFFFVGVRGKSGRQILGIKRRIAACVVRLVAHFDFAGKGCAGLRRFIGAGDAVMALFNIGVRHIELQKRLGSVCVDDKARIFLNKRHQPDLQDWHQFTGGFNVRDRFDLDALLVQIDLRG